MIWLTFAVVVLGIVGVTALCWIKSSVGCFFPSTVTRGQWVHLLFLLCLGTVGITLVARGCLHSNSSGGWRTTQGYGGAFLAFLGFGGLFAVLVDDIIKKEPRIPFWLNEWLLKSIFLLCMPLPLFFVDMPTNRNLDPMLGYWIPKVFGSIFLLAAAGYGCLYVKTVVTYVRNYRIARSNAHKDKRAFVLLLRPFNTRSLFEHSATVGIYGSQIPDASVSILPLLEQAITVTRPMVVLSDVRTPIRDRQWSSLVVKSTDTNWRELFELLARSCKAMVIIPADSSGLIHEISSIIAARMLDRCVFYQPPVYYFLPDVIAHLGAEIHVKIVHEMTSNWQKVAQRFRPLGLELPQFDNEGNFFCYDSNANLCSCQRIGSVEGQDQVVSIHRAAFNYVLNRISRTGEPLNGVITQIEMIEGK